MIRVLPLALCACATWTATGSLVRTPCWHIGLRGSTSGDQGSVDGVALEARVSTDAPWCAAVYPGGRP